MKKLFIVGRAHSDRAEVEIRDRATGTDSASRAAKIDPKNPSPTW
jgi:hypothetical protein